MTQRALSVFICSFLSLSAAGQTAPSIVEVRVDQPGIDFDEYIEISGAPGASLAGFTYIVIGDDDMQSAPFQNGSIETVLDLSGLVIPADGSLLIAEKTFTLGTPDALGSFNFESADNTTHMIVAGFSGFDGQDLDTNDDGVLEATPWTSVASSVALLLNAAPDGVNADFFYSLNTVGPDAGVSPSHAWMCSDSLAWRVGAIDPASGADSPGMANAACGAGGAVIRINEIRLSQSGNENDEYFELTGDAGASLNGYAYLVIGDGTAPNLNGVVECAIVLDGYSIGADGNFVAGEQTLTLATPDLVLNGLLNELNFEDSDNVNHMLVKGWSGAILADVDADNNCAIETPLWTEIVDSVSIVGGALELGCRYSLVVVGPDVSFVPGHVYRCEPDGEWRIGAFSASAGGDTPGAANHSCSIAYIPECGQAETGLCTTPHTSPFCADSNCCNAVCAVSPTCCSVTWDAACVAVAAIQCGSGSSSCDLASFSLSEIRLDHPGTDVNEYVEIKGAPGANASALTFVIIGDGTALSGTVEYIKSLAGVIIPSDGSLLLGNSAMTIGVPDVVLTTSAAGIFENSDNVTYLLVQGFTGVAAQDLDTNDDGVLDVTPWTLIVDHVALIESSATPPIGTEWSYSTNRVGPDGVNVPGHIWRCEDSGCWNIGIFDVALGNDTAGVTNANCEPLPPNCPADLDGDTLIAGGDLAMMLGMWGSAGGAADLDADGIVAGGDLSLMLAAWGPCPP